VIAVAAAALLFLSLRSSRPDVGAPVVVNRTDFVLTVEVEEHAVFRREGDDLHCVVPVGMVEAAMGGHVEVPTPDGPVTIEIPAGTQNGQRFRLRKRGVPRPGDGGRGDLWGEARIVIPAATDDRARALLRELAAVLPRS
jgi:molecular chaperone DnaJ